MCSAGGQADFNAWPAERRMLAETVAAQLAAVEAEQLEDSILGIPSCIIPLVTPKVVTLAQHLLTYKVRGCACHA